jgi:Protein of unknown function (DUF1360)
MTPLDLAILALATWRVSHMIAKELGPFQVFERLRVATGAMYIANRNSWQGTNTLSQLLVCPLCLSVWVAIAFVVMWVLLPVSQIVLIVLAISGGASAIELTVGGR